MAWRILASHEKGLNTFESYSRQFATGEAADMSVDMHNNRAGIWLGLQFEQTTDMNFIARQVLGFWKEHGLYTAIQMPSGQWQMSKNVISQDKYDALMDALSRKNENGEWLK